MTVNEMMEQVKAVMGEDSAENLKKIRDFSTTLRGEENAAELLEALAEYAYTLVPEEERSFLEQTTFAAGKRMDQTFAEAQKCIDENDWAGAEKLLAAISETIGGYFENGNRTWFSFRNPFEYHLYRFLNPEQTEFERAPFDFAQYLSLYSYVLVNTGDLPAAIDAIQRAEKFNPVSTEPLFEHTEICKLLRDTQGVLTLSRKAMQIATTADRIGRICANLGWYCTEIGEVYAAAVFYFESIRFRPFRPVELELQDVMRRMKDLGIRFAPPSASVTADIFNKYSVIVPPNTDLVNLALVLAKQAADYERPELEGLFYRVAYDLTNTAEFKAELDRIDAEMAKKAAEEQA